MAAKHASIQQKIALSFLRVAALLVTVIFLIITLVLFPKIRQSELNYIQQDLQQTINTLEQEAANIGYHADDWAYWDDTYHYLAGEAPGYQQSTLNDGSLRDARLDFISLISLDGDIVWGRYLKPGNKDRSYSGAPTASGLWPARLISELRNQPEGVTSYLSTRFGVLCFAARPVLTTQKTGPSRGWIIMGRWLTDEFTAKINRQLQQSIVLQPVSENSKDKFAQQLNDNIQFHIEKLSLQQIRANALILDYKNKPAFTLTIDKKRIIFIEYSLTLLTAFLGLILAGSFCAWFLYCRVQKVILEPLSHLTESIEQLGSHQRLPLNNTFNRDDEISLLYQKYYEVTDKLLKTQKALETRSSQLEIETLTDPLTQLNNRRYLQRLLPSLSETMRATPVQHRLLFVIDIDYFKMMNDNFGHKTGDMVLVQLAELLKSIFHRQEHIIRMGGEEFLVIAQWRNQAQAEEQGRIYQAECRGIQFYRRSSFPPARNGFDRL